MSELTVGSLSGLAANSYVIDVASGSTLDLSAGAVLPAGSILQVVSTAKTDTFTTSSTSFTDVTGLSVSITPRSTSSKILVCVTLGYVDVASAHTVSFRLMRDAVSIGVGASATVTSSFAAIPDATRGHSEGINFLDSPASTSSTVYKVQITNESGTAYVNKRSDGFIGTVSSITVMEVAG